MKTTKRKLNVRLLRRIQKHILKQPKRFVMSHSVIRAESQKEWWHATVFSDDASRVIPPCGTAACIAGWADLLTGGDGQEPFVRSRAAAALGVEDNGSWSGNTLFYARDWPEPFATRYKKADRPSRRAKVASVRIEHLIAKGE